MTCAQQLLLDLPVKSGYSETDYVESPCNQKAAYLIRNWPSWPVKMIAIHGEPGCGKTHLAHIWQNKSGARFLMPSDITALTPHDAVGDATALILDDADSLFHDASSHEDWMFHFYNLVKERGIDLLICSLYPPTQWGVTLPDLRSRLATIFSIAVNPPDEEALKAVLFKLCSEYGMILSVDVAAYILRRVERSFHRIRSLAAILNRRTLSQHRQLTLALVREVLNDL